MVRIHNAASGIITDDATTHKVRSERRVDEITHIATSSATTILSNATSNLVGRWNVCGIWMIRIIDRSEFGAEESAL